MFTGIIEAKGNISSLQKSEAGCRLTVSSEQLDFSDLSIGDSIAVSGACLTAIAIGNKNFQADVSNETLACTTLGSLIEGSQVNLEKALRADSRLGGHMVSGHVDGLAELISREADGESVCLWFAVPQILAHYIARKGSVCLDGVSLTVNDVRSNEFSVNIIPHTAEITGITNLQSGQRVNLEVDLLSRYLERLLQNVEINGSGEHDAQKKSLTLAKLMASGFVK